MRGVFMFAVVVAVAASLLTSKRVAASGSGSASWSFNPSTSNGPSNWGTLEDASHQVAYPSCNGQSQSPINFGSVAVKSTLKPLNPTWGGNVINIGATLVNDGHAIKLSLPSTGQPTLQFVDPNTGKSYNLLQFHFHSPSEHTFGQGFRDMEMHMVHQNPDDKSVLVLGVTFVASASGSNNFLNRFWDNINYLDWNGYSSLPSSRSTTLNLTLTDVLPPSRGYFTYSGSFTTPPCTEGVTWYVMRDAVPMGSDALNAIRSAMYFGGSWTGQSQYVPRGNYRPVQRLNGRQPQQFDDAAGAAMANLSPVSSAALSLMVTSLALSIVAMIVGGVAFGKAGKETTGAARASDDYALQTQ